MSTQLPKPKCCNLEVSWIFLVQVFCFSLQQILFCRCKDPLSVLWLHAATRVPNRNWDTPILICVIMKPGEITDRENRVKGRAGRCALNICRIWMIVMTQNRQSEEVLLNCDKYFSQFYGHYGWIINSCDDPGFCCFISCFILKSCPHLSCFSPSLCVISLRPVFFVPSLTCSLPLHLVPSSVCIKSLCSPLVFVRSFLFSSCVSDQLPPVLFSRFSSFDLAVCARFMFLVFSLILTLLLFAALLLLLCVFFVFMTHCFSWILVFFVSFSLCSPSVPSFYRWNTQCFYSFIAFTSYFLKFCRWHSHTFIFLLEFNFLLRMKDVSSFFHHLVCQSNISDNWFFVLR